MARSKYMQVIIKPSNDIIEALQEQMQKTPGLLRTALKRQGTAFKRRINKRLKEEPPPPSYPLRWQSEKQRRAFFATNGFGRGIGAPRTHALARGWVVNVDRKRDLEIEVYNRQSYARFVVGADQQNFHIDTGWMDANAILSDENAKFEDAIIETFFTVGDPTAGIL